MTCRICGESAPVYQTIRENDHVIRYRKCNKCEHKFRTLEMDDDIWVNLSNMKSIKDVTVTIGNAISDHLTISKTVNIQAMAKFIARRLFVEVGYEM